MNTNDLIYYKRCFDVELQQHVMPSPCLYWLRERGSKEGWLLNNYWGLSDNFNDKFINDNNRCLSILGRELNDAEKERYFPEHVKIIRSKSSYYTCTPYFGNRVPYEEPLEEDNMLLYDSEEDYRLMVNTPAVERNIKFENVPAEAFLEQGAFEEEAAILATITTRSLTGE